MQIGTEFPPQTFQVTRADLVRYAGASGDFNPIHWSDRVATSVGLPGVIAHGMLTMALAGQAVARWVGGTASIVEYSTRFANPVVVPDDDKGTEVVVTGVVKKQLEDGLMQIDIAATCRGEKVLGAAKALVRGR
ncbi:MaoC family dehydratase N-terminal domain-containing protein [Dactylosporangium roseum]|uniref:MaoC family dehydratase N-terminal domain-containing protein n=1 Tax=Dactylosporangium roseum TaxID=47989 RepID=A0ABY5Z2P5_9ACTN|nr:MaoC/PaaZ C-terminal domain-containing protein [Dactylosporangium roseum]UWZ36077.1 MaoC family dehydratase N-terminal domain-containing protein [Dactylosporangium roseum]